MAGAGAEAGHGGGGRLRVFLAKGHVKPVLLVVDGSAGHPILFLIVEDRTTLTAVAANSTGKTRARVGASYGRATPDLRFPQLVICDVADPSSAMSRNTQKQKTKAADLTLSG